jgi:hypothetical protein
MASSLSLSALVFTLALVTSLTWARPNAAEQGKGIFEVGYAS